MREDELDANAELCRIYEHDKTDEDQAGSKLPYRFIEDYSVENPQGQFETLEQLRMRVMPRLILRGKLMPREGEDSQDALEVEVPIAGWSMYAHPDEKYRGLWLQSKLAEYHMGAPSAEYEVHAEQLLESVRNSVLIHLFITDVVDLDDVDDDQALGLDTLLGMMEDQGVDVTHIYEHAHEIHELLRALHLNKNLAFMKQLKAVKPSRPQKRESGNRGDSETKRRGKKREKTQTEESSAAASSTASKAKKPRDAVSSPSSVSPPKQASSATESIPQPPCRAHGNGAKEPRPVAGPSGVNSGRPHHSMVSGSSAGRGASSSSNSTSGDGEREVPKKKRSRATAKASASAADQLDGPTSGRAAKSGKAHNKSPEAAVGLATSGDASPKLNEEVRSIVNQIAGLSNRLLRCCEAEKIQSSSYEKPMMEVERLLDRLDAEGFQPLPYLLNSAYGGEAFFHPFFELYKVVKRIRLTCLKEHKSSVAALRRRIVVDFTDIILRDVWLLHNRERLARDVRALKDQEKAAWIDAKRGRLEEQRLQRRAEKEEKKKGKEERRREWESGRAERQEQRRLARLATKSVEAVRVEQEDGVFHPQQDGEEEYKMSHDDDRTTHDDSNPVNLLGKRPAPDTHHHDAGGKRSATGHDDPAQAMQVDAGTCGAKGALSTIAAGTVQSAADAIAYLRRNDPDGRVDGAAESKCTLSPLVCPARAGTAVA